ncbi:3-isopropylmalate dehydratase large subunit [Kiritimatiella glycovorans]|uniref:3-isopropylmalate dehydratase large subunit n=1 Tax=Kiritimatiella glycovorans TaxID=1307763 RepID=A0A0G3EIQ5_9BACT|nr:3-isopropylmalate dehydratase large subunit [Kiritimatiella glycovorans]AKJ64710.1 3-isopropylmalate dehydratase large subunit [Kiritimatiella glycovorans]
MEPQTLFDKVWNRHVVTELGGGEQLLYVDRHLVHEVTSPQAFEGLRLKGRRVRRPERTFATMDHNVPTGADRLCVRDEVSRAQIEALDRNCGEFGVRLFGLGDDHQGIVHIIGPELGITLPGQTVVCGDSHTATHGAFGSLAFGIGTSEVEHVLATQTIRQRKPAVNRVLFMGDLPGGCGAKDLILRFIGLYGTAAGTGAAFEFCGPAVRTLSMEGRFTICNMAIEAGARTGMIAPDEMTFDYLRAEERPYAPGGAALDRAIEDWRTLTTDEGAHFDHELEVDLSSLEPQVTWGTSPGMVTGVNGRVPQLDEVPNYRPADVQRALDYMGLKPGQAIGDIEVDTVFIGSCTNGRIEDLREAAEVMKNRRVAQGVRVLVVPGSERVRHQAEQERLDRIFVEAGAEWRYAGCSMCLAMNPDRLEAGERCASTSNRNFEGRQGMGGRTHLVSPRTAAAAAVSGRFTDPREF